MDVIATGLSPFFPDFVFKKGYTFVYISWEDFFNKKCEHVMLVHVMN